MAQNAKSLHNQSTQLHTVTSTRIGLYNMLNSIHITKNPASKKIPIL